MTPDPAPAINPFVRLWDMGYRRLVPIVPPLAELSPTSSMAKRPACRGKAVGICGPSGKFYGFNWHQHETTEDDLARWYAMGAGVGCKTGQGLVAIDVDTLDRDLSALAYAAALEILGHAPRRVGRAPKVLLPYRVSETTGYRRVSFAAPAGKTEMVEMLGEGRQFVMGGIHPGTMEPYRWPDGVPAYSDLTLVSHAQIDAFFERLVAIMPEAQTQGSSKANVDRALIDQASLTAPLHHITKVLAAIPNDESNRDQWINVGTALRAALPDDPEEAFALWWEFSLRHNPDKDYEAVVSEWNRLPQPPWELGAPYLYGLASKATGENQMPAERYFQPVAEGDVDTSGFPETAPRREKAPLVLTRFADAAWTALTDRSRPLIKGLLDQSAMSVLYGDSNTGKTFIAMSMAYAISRGLPWGGLKTTEMVVVYVVAEGSRGAKRRVAALARKHGDSAKFFLLMAPVDLLRPNGDLNEIVALVRSLGVPVGLIIIDTLSRAMAGGNENDSVDMGMLVKHLDALREATHAHVMVVHHTGKEKSKGARGHSLLRAATDTEIEVEAGQLAVSKQRDLDKSYASAFELEVVKLGEDEEGEAITSCTVRLLDKAAEVAPGVPTPKEQEVLKAMETCVDTAADPTAGVTAQEVQGVLGEAMSLTDVRFHLRSMVAKNLLRKVQRGRWAIKDNLSAARFFSDEGDVFS
jgi:hypothetical protein